MKIVFSGQNFSTAIIDRDIRGVSQNFEVVVRPRITLCIPVTADRKMVLIREHRVAVDMIVMEFPAGRLEPNEDSETAIRRELLEKTGFRATELAKLGTLLTAPHFCNESMDVFIAKGAVSLAPTPTEREDLREIVQIPASAVEDLIRDGQLTDAKSIAAFALAQLTAGPGWSIGR